MRGDEVLLEETGGSLLEFRGCQEWQLGCNVGRWWCVILVAHGTFELTLGHGSVRLFNVLGDSPQQVEVLDTVSEAPESSLSFKVVFGL